ncbi:MAG: hypothetical protein ACO1TE_14480 [Prosthecobacter sp.]
MSQLLRTTLLSLFKIIQVGLTALGGVHLTELTGWQQSFGFKCGIFIGLLGLVIPHCFLHRSMEFRTGKNSHAR